MDAATRTSAMPPVARSRERCDTPERAAHRLTDGVFVVEEDGVAHLLDFDRGRFYALDSIGTRLLMATLEAGLDAAAARTAARYGVPLERVRADLDALLRRLERCKLVTGADAPPRRTGGGPVTGVRPTVQCPLPRAPGRARVVALLVAAWLCLRLLGWNRTLSLWRRLHRPASQETAVPPALLEAIDREVRDAASRILPQPMNCKERALAAFQILRARLGVPATLVVGIQRHPFVAHAWVECAGRAITDDAARCETFTPVARYA